MSILTSQYIFPSHYPSGCPPQPQQELCGTYYRLFKNNRSTDPSHYKSYYELGINTNRFNPCARRALSIFSERNDAINLSKNFPILGKYVATLNLNGGHGIICNNGNRRRKSHCDWWVPIGICPANYCTCVEGPLP